MKNTAQAISLAITGAFALSIAASSASAAENPFSAKPLSSAYQVAENDSKMKDGKCATGQCGASHKSTAKKTKEDADEIKKEKTDKTATGQAKEDASHTETKK